MTPIESGDAARVEMARLLGRASQYHFLSLLFRPPSAGLLDEMAALVPSLAPTLRERATNLLAEASPTLEHEYHVFLGGSGMCPDCESDYEVNALGGKGPLLADVAGFYKAFSFEAATALRLQADHISVELDFLGFLALKAAYAVENAKADERDLCERAAAAFIADHIGRFAPTFFERLGSQAGDRFHGSAARFAAELGGIGPRPGAQDAAGLPTP
jgi:TorA maturation chaperone TorD